jgi:hypothetical protein
MAIDVTIDGRLGMGLLDHIRQRDQFEADLGLRTKVFDETVRSNKVAQRQKDRELGIQERDTNSLINYRGSLAEQAKAIAESQMAATAKTKFDHRVAMSKHAAKVAGAAGSLMANGDEAAARRAILGGLVDLEQVPGEHYDQNASTQELLDKLNTLGSSGDQYSLAMIYSGAARGEKSPHNQSNVLVPESVKAAEEGMKKQQAANAAYSSLSQIIETEFGGDESKALQDPEFQEAMYSLAEQDPTLAEVLGARPNVDGTQPPRIVRMGDTGYAGVAITNTDGEQSYVTRQGTKWRDNPDDPPVMVTPGQVYSLIKASAEVGRNMIEPAVEAAAATTPDITNPGSPIRTIQESADMLVLGPMFGLDAASMQNAAAGRAVGSEQVADAQVARGEFEARRKARIDIEAKRAAEYELYNSPAARDARYVNKNKVLPLEFENDFKAYNTRAGENTPVDELVLFLAGVEDKVFMRKLRGVPGLAERLGDPLRVYGGDPQNAVIDYQQTYGVAENAKMAAEMLGLVDDYGNPSNLPEDWNRESRQKARTALLLTRQFNNQVGRIDPEDMKLAAQGLLPDRNRPTAEFIARGRENLSAMVDAAASGSDKIDDALARYTEELFPSLSKGATEKVRGKHMRRAAEALLPDNGPADDRYRTTPTMSGEDRR